MNEKKRSYAVKFDSFASNGKKHSLWIMPNGSMLILIEHDGVILENITLKNARLTPDEMLHKYRKLALDQGIKEAIQEVDSFENTEKSISLWRTNQDNSLHIIISTNDIVEDYVSSRDSRLDEARIALLFKEIKSDMIGNVPEAEPIPEPGKEFEQAELFSDAA